MRSFVLHQRTDAPQMDSWLTVATLAALLVATAQSQDFLCPDECVCVGGFFMSCNENALDQPPVGHWPDVTELELMGNNISKLHRHSLTGFPNIEKLRLDGNRLTELDLMAFEGTPSLRQLFVYDSGVRAVTGAEEALLPSLTGAYLANNAIARLDPDAFARAAPRLQELDLIGNPLAVEEDQRVLNHPTLQLLAVSGCHIPSLGPVSLAGLPSLSGLYMKDCGLTRVTAGAFSANPIEVLTLGDNPLERFDLAAVRGAPGVRSLNIDDTALACTCGYAPLHWWALGTDVLSARCESRHPCAFSRFADELRE